MSSITAVRVDRSLAGPRGRVGILRCPMARSARSKRGFGLVRTLNLVAFMPIAARAPTYGRLLLTLLRDERIPIAHKAILGLAAAYLVSPVDLIPEALPILGALDDVAVVLLALDVFLDSVPEAMLAKALEDLDIDRDALERDRAQVRRFIPRPVRALARRLPRALDTVVHIIQRSDLEGRMRERFAAGPKRPGMEERPA